MDFKDMVKGRIEKRLRPVIDILPKEFYLAGNCLNRSEPKDLDLFPTYKSQPFNIDNKYVVLNTKNAITAKYDNKIIQFCHYYHESLKKLVTSFDFAHVQIGAEVKIVHNTIQVKEIYYTKAYEDSKLREGSFYTGSEYPLSSLVRLVKYQNRNYFAGRSYIGEIIKILANIVQRGFKDYDDFKDQLDAVDLGMVPEDLKDSDFSELMTLYELLTCDEKKQRERR